MTNFSSSKNLFTVLILWGLISFLSIITFLNFKFEALQIIPLIIIIVIIGIILWILYDTRYVIKDKFLLFRSGPFRGKIDINCISKIKYHDGFNIPVTFKPALNYKGFIISYNTFDDVFVSPKNHDLFIEELLKINSKIEVL